MLFILTGLTVSGFTDTKYIEKGWGKWLRSLGSSRKNLESIINKLGKNEKIKALIGEFSYYDFDLLRTKIETFINETKPILNINETLYNNFDDLEKAIKSLNEGYNETMEEMKKYINNTIEQSKEALSSNYEEIYSNFTKLDFMSNPKATGKGFVVSFAGAILLFIILFIFAILYCLFAQFACCCCKCPKFANWPGIPATVFFWIGIALYLIGAIIRITGLTTAKDYGNIFANINKTACEVTKTLGEGINTHGTAIINSLSTLLTKNLTTIFDKIYKSIDGSVDEIDTWMDELFKSIYETNTATPENYKNKTLVDSVNRIKLKAQQLNDAIAEVKKKQTAESTTEVKNISFEQINEMIDKIPKWKEDGIKFLRDKAHGFIKDFQDKIDDSVKTMNISGINQVIDYMTNDDKLNHYCSEFNFTNIEKIGKKINCVFIVMFLFTFLCALVGILWMARIFYGHGCCSKCTASCTCCKACCCGCVLSTLGSVATIIGCVLVLSLPSASNLLNEVGSFMLPRFFGSKGIDVIVRPFNFEVAYTNIEIGNYSLTYPTGRIVDYLWPADPDPNLTFISAITSGLDTIFNYTAVNNGFEFSLQTILPAFIKKTLYTLLNSTAKPMVDEHLPRNMQDLKILNNYLTKVNDSLEDIEKELDDAKNAQMNQEDKNYIKDRIKEVRVAIYCNSSITEQCMNYSYSSVFYESLEENVLDKLFIEKTFCVNTSHKFGQKGFRELWNTTLSVFGGFILDIKSHTIDIFKMRHFTNTLNAVSSPVYQYTYRQSKLSIYNMLCLFGLFIIVISYFIRRQGMLMPDKVKDGGNCDDDYSYSDKDMKTKYGKTSSGGGSYSSDSKRYYISSDKKDSKDKADSKEKVDSFYIKDDSEK